MAEYERNSLCSEDTNSLYDEERIRKLFQACDTNGDGYIDSNDLLTVCRELNLEYSLEELMQELGADENGRISYDEFLRRRLALKPEIEALRNTDLPQSTPEYIPTSSDNSLEGASGSKERWEFDSGARDLSPEPNTLQRLVEAAGGSITTSNAASLLQLANKLHLAALASLRGEITELTYKLEATTEERDRLQLQVKKNENLHQAENITEQYEERITELHSVIAELSRKLERQGTLVIEEEAPSEAENSVDESQETDNYSPANIDPEGPFQKIASGEMKSKGLREELEVLKNNNNDLEAMLLAKEEELKATRAVMSPFKEKLKEMADRLRKESSSSGSSERLHAPGSSGCIDELGLHQMDLILRKLDRVKADNQVLQLSLQEAKRINERLTLLLGKYESNITALRLALNSTEKAIEAYEKLDVLLSSGSKRVARENDLRNQISAFCAEKERVYGTVAILESYVEDASSVVSPHCVTYSPPKIDLETAVLVQEVMREREERGETRGKLAAAERENKLLEVRLQSLEATKLELLETIHKLQLTAVEGEEGDGQQKDLRHREKLSKSLQRQSELTNQLKNANHALMHSLEKHKRKAQAKIHRMETQMLDMVEHHAAQVRALKHRLYELEQLLGENQRNQCSGATGV